MTKFSTEMFRPLNFILGTFACIFAGLLSVGASYASEGAVFAEDGVAIRGADVVAYFTQGERVDGSTDFTTEHEGVVWQFASGENRDSFVADPAKYVPAYGGYCAYALSLGAHKVATDPDSWTIVDDRLYLNKTLRMRELWRADVPGRIEKADANWAKLSAH